MITAMRGSGASPAAVAPTVAPKSTRQAAETVSAPHDSVALSAPHAEPQPATTVASQVAGAATPGPLGVCLRVILSGPPGAGKTTHGTAIAKQYGLPEISTGNLLRAEVEAGTELGKQAAAYMERGDLVPLEIVSQVLENRLVKPDTARGFVLDGMPRRLDDAHLLERLCDKLHLPAIPMVLLDVPDSEIIGRVENRRVCDNQHVYDVKNHPPHTPDVCDEDGLPLHRRPDDDPTVVKHRLDVYHQETEPAIQYFEEHGLLHAVNGVGSIAEVTARVLDTVSHLTTSA